ncbi:MAG: MBL fold metallo-hydrolase [Gammaproteobacteria bacterium]
MSRPTRVVTDTMAGLSMPDHAILSPCVATVLGRNPGPFTGPGTNTYLVGTGRRPVLLDTGAGLPIYDGLLATGLGEMRGAHELQQIVLTHVHQDHIGGAAQVRARYGDLRVTKRHWPGKDDAYDLPFDFVDDGAIVRTDGATLRAVHTPGHALDHLCWYLEEEKALFTGDVVLGAGTTIVPEEGGGLGDYMASLRRLLTLDLAVIYPAHGPAISDPYRKLQDYIAHRELREQQILEALRSGPATVEALVLRIYVDTPAFLHAAAANSVRSHLAKLQREGRAGPADGHWHLAS